MKLLPMHKIVTTRATQHLGHIKKLSMRGGSRSTAGVLAVVLVLVLGAFLFNRENAQEVAHKQQVMAQLDRDQKAKANELAKQATTVASSQQDASQLQFKDVTEGSFKKQTCARLAGRAGINITSTNCDYSLRAHGKLNMAVVYVYEDASSIYAYDALSSLDNGDNRSMGYINTYLAKQAQRYRVADPPSIEIKSFGPYALVSPVSHLYYRDSGPQVLDVFNTTSQTNKVPEDQYDMVSFVLLDASYGGMAFPSMHRAFTYNYAGSTTTAIFVHETLHLFGATDKYYNQDCETIGVGDPFGRYQGTNPGTDIMCSNFDLEYSSINDITAREIGWAN